MDKGGESDQNQYSSSKFEEEAEAYDQENDDKMVGDMDMNMQMDGGTNRDFMVEEMEAINEEEEDQLGCQGGAPEQQ